MQEKEDAKTTEKRREGKKKKTIVTVKAEQ